MDVLYKDSILISESVSPVVFSGIDNWINLKSNNYEENKKTHPWHLCIEAKLETHKYQLDAFLEEIKLHDIIEILLDSRINEKTHSVKLFSLIEEKHIKHYWQLSQPLENLTFSEILLIDEINMLKPLAYTMCEDKDWLLATNKINKINK